MSVLIVDDHALMSNALAALMKKIRPEWQSKQMESGREALNHLATDPDVQLILLDLFMPDTDGFELISTITDQYPYIPLINISASVDPGHIARAMQLGSRAYIPKSSPTHVIAEAIEQVLAGKKYLPANISLDNDQDGEHSYSEIHHDLSDVEDKLTERQLQIFYLLGQGKSNKEIAQDLFISTNTVKIHVSAILSALSLNNRTQTGIFSKMLQEEESRKKQIV